MHLFFMTRGIYHEVERSMDFLKTMMFPYTTYEGEKPIEGQVQAHLQPIQLWSLVFPEEEKDKLLRGFKFENKYKSLFSTLRLALGAKKIPSYNPEGPSYFIYKNNIQFIPIGIKQDKRTEKGTEML